MSMQFCKSRAAFVALLCGACFSLVSWTGPVLASQDISVGQAGDPGDGLDFAAGGSNGALVNNNNGSRESLPPRSNTPVLEVRILLVPIFDGVVPRFVVIRIPENPVERFQ